jgi:serine O-acetyltransferase
VIDGIPAIRAEPRTDVAAALQNDPAARSFDEVLLAYSFVEAIATHRVAHELYRAGVHPASHDGRTSHRGHGHRYPSSASIGRHFFIDHGTGVVIGETAVIGERVTLYQGVTIGAKNEEQRTHNQRGVKRHPTLKDGVTVYAGSHHPRGDHGHRGRVRGGRQRVAHP